MKPESGRCNRFLCNVKRSGKESPYLEVDLLEVDEESNERSFKVGKSTLAFFFIHSKMSKEELKRQMIFIELQGKKGVFLNNDKEGYTVDNGTMYLSGKIILSEGKAVCVKSIGEEVITSDLLSLLTGIAIKVV